MSELVSAATAELDRALRPAFDRDWSVPAGDVEWSCRHTVSHIADDLFSYASQVVAQPTRDYLPIEAVIDPRASNEDMVRAVSMCGELLRYAVEAASPDARGWHPMGTSDPNGFAAMGALEALVHTYDIVQGLQLDWTPPGHLCAPILRRLFPGAPDGDASAVLLYCTGRAALAGLARQADWSWDSTVREEVSRP
jgi:hypothetical protein